jgi:methylenetetrahydrofolate reductase (NADPH)
MTSGLVIIFYQTCWKYRGCATIIPLLTDEDKTVAAEANRLKESLLDRDTFCITWELVAGKGAFEKQQETILQNAQVAAKGNKVHGISVTDNPSGNPAISSEMLCAEIVKLGIEPLVHLALRDKNRNEVESLLYGLAAGSVHNILFISGDYPAKATFDGKAKPVFDLDPTHAVQLIAMMNRGLEYESLGKKLTLAPNDFFGGVAASPFKKTEAELMGQYYKLDKKIKGGAQFIISQLGYDARKMHELLLWLKVNGYDIPALANIYVLTYPAARLINSNQLPGCVVTDKLLADLVEERQAEDKGRAARLLRAAKMYALTKGMGYAGAHIGGHGLSYEMLEEIIAKGEQLAPRWQELVAEFDYQQDKGFYFFAEDDKTGLNIEKPASRKARGAKPLMYRFSRIIHESFFEPGHPFFGGYRRLAKRADSSRWMKEFFTYMEHVAKVAIFSCQQCGDCALFDAAYLCPTSQCPKNQRLGPCGGSYDGWCEIYPNERQCIWVRAYTRLKAYKEEDSIGAYISPPCNWELWETSSWLNFYLGRDHTAKRLGIKPPAEATKPEN